MVVASFIAATALAASAKFAMQMWADKQDAKIMRQVRAFFSQKGEIATVFVNQAESTRDIVCGGVVMADDKVYTFTYMNGDLDYWEERT